MKKICSEEAYPLVKAKKAGYYSVTANPPRLHPDHIFVVRIDSDFYLTEKGDMEIAEKGTVKIAPDGPTKLAFLVEIMNEELIRLLQEEIATKNVSFETLDLTIN